MAIRLIMSSEAKEDMEALASWRGTNISQKNKLDFLAAIAQTCRQLTATPLLGKATLFQRGVREINSGRHYKLYYIYAEETVTIIGLVDMRRQPGSLAQYPQ